MTFSLRAYQNLIQFQAALVKQLAGAFPLHAEGLSVSVPVAKYLIYCLIIYENTNIVIAPLPNVRSK